MSKSLYPAFLVMLTVLCLGQPSTASAQEASASVNGTVLDDASNKPLEFARVVLYRVSDSSMVTGAVSDVAGHFLIERIPSGRYYAEVVFLGYQIERKPSIEIDGSGAPISLGTIRLRAGALDAAEVIVQGERPALQYRIDRKVLDTRSWSTTASGTAVEVLEQIPSVSVDIEGNVNLRGSGSFTVLIDGKPSILDPQDALQQIPASSIATIEVITNPSAKFDPEGTAGVINIVLSKRKDQGVSGTITANAGENETYGGDAMINFRTDRVETVASLDHNNRSRPGSEQIITTYPLRDSANGLASVGASSRQRTHSGFRGSVRVQGWEGGTVGFRARFSNREWGNGASQLFETMTDNVPLSSHINRTDRRRGGYGLDLGMDVEQFFEVPEHVLRLDLSFGRRDGDERTISELIQNAAIIEGRKTTEAGPSNDLEFRVEYERPVGAEGTFESGYKAEIDRNDDNTNLSLYDLSSSSYVLQPLFSHRVRSNEQEHALYAVYGNTTGSLGYQVGLRTEATIRSIELADEGQRFSVNEWEFFPTLHLSYRFEDGQQLMASYSRRIDRPRGWELEPFLTWIDATSVRTGNPGLRPEYIDAYEAGAQTFSLGIPLNLEVYYRRTQNRVEGIRSVYAPNVTLHTFENVGTDASLGLETMATIDPWGWWDLQAIGNLYRYSLDAMILGQQVHRSTAQWSGRLNSMFKITRSTRLQFSVRINSESQTAQEREEGYTSADLGLRQTLMQGRLTLTLQVRDMFGSVRRESVTTAADFIRSEIRHRDGPVFLFNLRVNLGGEDREEEMNSQEERSFDEGE